VNDTNKSGYDPFKKWQVVERFRVVIRCVEQSTNVLKAGKSWIPFPLFREIFKAMNALDDIENAFDDIWYALLMRSRR